MFKEIIKNIAIHPCLWDCCFSAIFLKTMKDELGNYVKRLTMVITIFVCTSLTLCIPSNFYLVHALSILSLNKFYYSSKKGKEPKTPSGPFSNDVVLLARPEENLVPRQAAKHYLAVNGHVLYGCSFRKEWDNEELMANLKSLFPDKLTDDVR